MKTISLLGNGVENLFELMKKNKAIILNVIITLTFSAIITISMCNSKSLNYDTIWGFHAAQKVANGYTMYTEINTVLTPIFFWIGALFIKIFGNAVISLYICSGIIGGVLITTVYNILKKIDKEESSILFLAFICFVLKNIYIIGAPSYNILALMWWLLAVFLELENINQKHVSIKNNILIGILTGLIIFTKQSIGVFAFISTIIITLLINKNSNRENIKKEILSKILGLLLIVFGMLIYFIFTNSFSAFVDFCICGLFDFGTKNMILQIPLIYMGIVVLAILGVIFSKKKQDKSLIILTVTQISMMSLIFPVTNTYHIVLSMLISLPLFGGITKQIENKEIYKIIFMIFSFGVLCIQKESAIREYSLVENLFIGELFAGQLILTTVLLCFVGLIVAILFEKEKLSVKFIAVGLTFLLCSQILVNNELQENEKISLNLDIYRGLNLEEKAYSYLEDVLKYIKDKELEGNKVLVVSADSSYYMAPLERSNYIYDFALYGSLGEKGEKLLVDLFPKDNNLLVIKNKHMMYQESKLLEKFIKENFRKTDEIYDLEVYKK